MDVVAIIISIVSLLGAGVGTYLANKRSSEAIADAREATAVALWSDAQVAVQHFIGFDPTMEPVGDRMVNFRVASVALVDGLKGDWRGFDQWLQAEHRLGTGLARQVMEKAKHNDTIEERLAILQPYQTWAAVLASNLRLFRSNGYDGDAVAKLRRAAEEHVEQIYTSNGWTVPPTTLPGVKPLDA